MGAKSAASRRHDPICSAYTNQVKLLDYVSNVTHLDHVDIATQTVLSITYMVLYKWYYYYYHINQMCEV